ncbi:MAG: hypothetical protein KGH71_00285 [Candidatus Micrarchaeota archaeon]|nr:hypothetical protein [Candidatus Micrarchaeota archaeon]
MGIFSRTTGSMHNLTVLLLALFALWSSYLLGKIPYGIILALAVIVFGEFLIFRYYIKRAFKFPYSGIITGFIIGSVAPLGAPPLAILLACMAALVAKFLIRGKSGNIFNPATFGLLLGLGALGIGDEWWAMAPNFSLAGFAIPIAIVLIVAAYEARRLASSASFLVVSIALFLITGNSGGSLGASAAALLGMNFYFAFIMIADPKTSPHKGIDQMAFGGGIAAISTALLIYGVPYSLLIALLAGNLGYFLYRRFS